jgi:ATP-dependent DNA helicase RecQ
MCRGEPRESDSSSDAFRKWFSCVGELRSLVPKATLMTITATASEKCRKELKQKLSVVEMHEFVQSPDRLNIKLHVKKFIGSQPLHEVFDFLLHIINIDQYNMPRIMIFCYATRDCGRLRTMFISRLEHDLHAIVEMYHSDTLDHVKTTIVEDMGNRNGRIRLLLCTSAAGMGVNFAGVNYVINYGPPRTVDSLLQQMGRAGRDDTQSHHLLLYANTQCRGVDNELKTYARSADCRRKVLMGFYGGDVKFAGVKHLCCDLCTEVCKCNTEDCRLHERFPLLHDDEYYSNAYACENDCSDDCESDNIPDVEDCQLE